MGRSRAGLIRSTITRAAAKEIRTQHKLWLSLKAQRLARAEQAALDSPQRPMLRKQLEIPPEEP
jgi:hypothetical protein